jgi:hypothetical protein
LLLLPRLVVLNVVAVVKLSVSVVRSEVTVDDEEPLLSPFVRVVSLLDGGEYVPVDVIADVIDVWDFILNVELVG